MAWKVRLDYSGISIANHHKQYTYVEHSIKIVDVAVFPAAIVDIFARHTDFRTIEDRRLLVCQRSVPM